jgi:hypothetical protein
MKNMFFVALELSYHVIFFVFDVAYDAFFVGVCLA